MRGRERSAPGRWWQQLALRTWWSAVTGLGVGDGGKGKCQELLKTEKR